MKLYRAAKGALVENDGERYLIPDCDWNALTTRDDLAPFLKSELSHLEKWPEHETAKLLAPIGFQEVWAAGVTYFRSRTARMEESQVAGGGSFYDRVYSAERPELFFKSSPHRVVGPGESVHIRQDSSWNVPEPELALLITPSGKLIGYTIGNDMSSRDIEGANPLYLPQAKVYDRSCALGPGILVADGPLPPETRLEMEVRRTGNIAFRDHTTLSQMKRTSEVLIEYLFRDNSFPNGCFLLTGTGIVPPDSFTLERGDLIRIAVDAIGILENSVD